MSGKDERREGAAPGLQSEPLVILAAMGLGLFSLTKAHGALEDNVPPPSLGTWETLLVGSDALSVWTRALVEKFPEGKTTDANGRSTLVFPELDTALSLVKNGQARSFSKMRLVIAYDKNDEHHNGVKNLMEGWVEECWPRIRNNSGAPDLELRFIPVGILNANDRSVSALDEVVALNPSQDSGLDRANAVFHEEMLREVNEGDAYGSRIIINTLSGRGHLATMLRDVAEGARAKRRKDAARAVQRAADGHRYAEARPFRSPASMLNGRLTIPLPMGLDHSEAQHIFHRSVMLTYSAGDDWEDLATREGLNGYVRERSVGEGSRELVLTEPAWNLIESTDGFSGRPHSASAELLTRWGYPELAGRLSVLIEHWTRQQLWRVNLANEMVLHNEVHSQVVDRHVASLAEAVGLRPGEFEAEDLYHLALAAWLHDWGHAAGGTHSVGPVRPRDVRKFHGLLTRRRLQSSLHFDHHGLSQRERAWVGLLSAHHQGWTSCDAKDVASAETLDDCVKFGLVCESFDRDFWALDFENRSRDGEPIPFETAQLMLSILRVADGADLGQHRVPHRSSISGMLLDQWSILFNSVVDQLSLNPTVRQHFVDVFSADVSEALRLGPEGSVQLERIKQREARAKRDLANEIGEAWGPGMRNEWHRAFKEAIEHLAHLQNQETFFASHDSIAGVHLVPKMIADGAIVTPYVRIDGSAGEAMVNDALQAVQKDVRKELGLSVDGLRVENVRAHDALFESLAGVGVRIADAQQLTQPDSLAR